MVDKDLRLLIRELAQEPMIEAGGHELSLIERRVNDLIEAARYVDRLIVANHH